jgi:branched-chain amino acid transport system substrate-binding protein
VFQPLSTGITFALTEKAPGRQDPADDAGLWPQRVAGRHGVQVELPLGMGTYWVAPMPDPAPLAKKRAGWTSSRARNSPGVPRQPVRQGAHPLLQERADARLSNLQLLPVTAPGVEQKATWLQVRQSRPDYVLLWGWGVMNSTALKEAQATGYPRDKMYGVWWAGAEPDVRDVGEGAKGYNAVAMQHGAEPAGQGGQGHPEERARQGPGHRSQGRSGLRCCTCAAP